MCWDEDTRSALKLRDGGVGAEKDNLICIKTITKSSQIVRIRSFVLARVRDGRKNEDAEAFLRSPQPHRRQNTPTTLPTPTLSKHNLEIYFAALIFRFIFGIRTEKKREKGREIFSARDGREIKSVNNECNLQPDEDLGCN